MKHLSKILTGVMLVCCAIVFAACGGGQKTLFGKRNRQRQRNNNFKQINRCRQWTNDLLWRRGQKL